MALISSACSACLQEDLCDEFFGDEDDDDMYHECNWHYDDANCNDDCECTWIYNDESYYDQSDSLMYGGNCVDIDVFFRVYRYSVYSVNTN